MPWDADVVSRSRLLVLVGAALSIALLSACTSTSGTGSKAPTSPAASSTPTTSAVTSTGAPVPPTSAHSTTGSVGNGCSAAQLQVAGGPLPGGSAAGHTGVLLTFTNHSTATCTLFGYPGVAGVNSSGSQIAQATRTLNGYLAGCRCTTPQTVTLAPGAVASATTEGNVGSGQCDQFTALLVTPPNTATSTRIDMVPHSCGFTVHPVVAGSTGSG